MQLYQDRSIHPKDNAQSNLNGRTHYVDDDSLSFHKSRIIATTTTDNGLLFALVESYAIDYKNARRAFRHVIFDVFGKAINRPTLEEGVSTSKKAIASMWDALNNIDAFKVTEEGILNAETHHANEMLYLRNDLTKLKIKTA